MDIILLLANLIGIVVIIIVLEEVYKGIRGLVRWIGNKMARRK